LQNQQTALGDYSPEKAGVGGSTPSLATTFSIAYGAPANPSCPKLSQKLTGSPGVASNFTARGFRDGARQKCTWPEGIACKEDYRYPGVDYLAQNARRKRSDSYGHLSALPVLSLVALLASVFAGSGLFLSGAGLTT
jgi:hypothetical protein